MPAQCLWSLFSPPRGVSLPPLHVREGSIPRALGSPEQGEPAGEAADAGSRRSGSHQEAGRSFGKGSSGPT